MSQAYPQYRPLACHLLDKLDADAGLLWRARAGGDHDPFRLHPLDFRDGHLVVSTQLDLLPHFPEILHQVVGERVVVVEDEDHCFPLRADSTAFITAAALFTHSSCSLSGTESATMPAPTSR